MFVDQVKIYVKGGDGGRGCLSFCRQKYRPRGGPNGGDGGRGGDVILQASINLRTLLDFRYRPQNIAPRGGHGSGSCRKGRDAPLCILKVPVGTLVKDVQSQEVLGDLMREGEELVVARGGRGGWGNAHFKSSTNQAPRRVEGGRAGEERWLQLELKLMADVGLIGLPNAGKSTFLSRISAAHPKAAPYPFTTLTPKLGVVQLPDYRSFVVADIPGLIPGAHQGKGLGDRFLRHIERTSLLVHLVDLAVEDPIAAFHAVEKELEYYSPALARKPRLVVANKIDLPLASEKLPQVERDLRSLGIRIYPLSARTGQGVPALICVMDQRLREMAWASPEPVAEELGIAAP
ncbi:MAG: GTPase ObgE [Nitrospinae bacterium]|nr:GTPase ObgE [Nitrospinota bacterium]